MNLTFLWEDPAKEYVDVRKWVIKQVCGGGARRESTSYLRSEALRVWWEETYFLLRQEPEIKGRYKCRYCL